MQSTTAGNSCRCYRLLQETNELLGVSEECIRASLQCWNCRHLHTSSKEDRRKSLQGAR